MVIHQFHKIMTRFRNMMSQFLIAASKKQSNYGLSTN